MTSSTLPSRPSFPALSPSPGGPVKRLSSGDGLRRIFAAAAALALGGLSTGCQSPASEPQPSKTPALVLAKRADHLRIGMHKPQVLEWLGEPLASISGNNSNGMRETWTYRIEHTPHYKTVVAVMEKVPYYDPITGILRWLDEPVQNQQRTQSIETLTLTFRGVSLIDIERDKRELGGFRD